VAAVKRENLLRKELAWLRRGAPARTSKPRFRIDAAEALIADVPPPRDTVALTAMATARLGKKVLDLEDVTVRYPGSPTDTGEATQREVLRRVTWRLAPGERVGVVGVNGAGKTTLLRLLEGVQEPTEGRVARGKTVQVATLSQSTHELDALAEVIEGTGSPILVFYRFQAELEMIQERFPESVHVSESGAVKRWNAGRVPILLAHPASAGHGLNLQHGGHTIVWTSLPWSLEQWQQANKRLQRQGQTHPVVVHVIESRGTLDSNILRVLEGKAEIQAALLGHLESLI